MGNFSHSNLVAGTGGLKTSGNVYTNSANKRNLYDVKTGELVFYNPKTGTVYTDFTLANTNTQNVRVGVGVGKKGQLADNIRLLSRDTFKFNTSAGTTNDSLTYNVASASCAQTAIMDVYFCGADCNQTVSINIEADTPVFRQYMPENEIAKYSFSAVSDCGCETCNGDADMGSIVDQLVAKINGSFRKARYDQFFAGNNENDLIQPFSAARIWTSGSVPSGKVAVSKYFEFNFDTTTNCETCNAIEKIIAMRFTATGTLTTFTGVNDGTYTYVDQLQSVAEQITNKLNSTSGYSGHAYVSKVTGDTACCKYRIYVNAMVPTGETVILQAGSTPANNTGTDTTWTTSTDYGIRLFLDPIDLNFEDNYPPQQFFPNLYQSIDVAGFTGFGCCNPTVVSRQLAVIPEGLGYLYVEKEIEQHNGGRGRNFFYDSPSMGLRGLPDASTAYANTTIDAKKNYTVYSFLYKRNTTADMVPGSPVIGYTDEFKLLIPTGTTLTTINQYITAFAAKFKG